MVMTTADEKKNSACSHIQTAINDLSDIIIHKCWGYEDFTTEYKTTLHYCLNDLLKIRDRLENP